MKYERRNEFKKGTTWIFGDIAKKYDKRLFKITDVKEIKSKSGTDIPTLVLVDGEGEFYLSFWNCINCDEIADKLGDDTDLWIDHDIRIIPDGAKVRLVLVE